MDEINRVLGDEGAGFPVIACGKTWLLSRLTQQIKAKFATWLVAKALANAREARPLMTPREHRETLGAINDRMVSGEYGWGEPVCNAALLTDEGGTAFMLLLMQKHHPKVTEKQVAAILADNPEGVRLAVEQLMAAVPNSQSPAAGGNGTGEEAEGAGTEETVDSPP